MVQKLEVFKLFKKGTKLSALLPNSVNETSNSMSLQLKNCDLFPQLDTFKPAAILMSYILFTYAQV